jgi:AraC-like DNA-binding protein
VEEISEKCGFGSISYFCRIFKQEEACTPLQYRKSASLIDKV